MSDAKDSSEMVSSTRILAIVATIASFALVNAHTVITYPGWRGDNLVTNDTFPYGMQWMYPCEYTLFSVLESRSGIRDLGYGSLHLGTRIWGMGLSSLESGI